MSEEHPHDYDIPPATSDVLDVATAFVVYQTTDGMCVGAPVVATLELRGDDGKPVRLRTARQATADDLWRGCAEVMKDVNNAQAAALIVEQMLAISRAAISQQRNAEIAEKVRQNLFVPGR